MGYCYSNGYLCCDICGATGGVRKYRCPFNWCPPVAMCPSCKRAHPEYLTRAYHREHGNCEEHHLRYQRELQRTNELLEAGEYIRQAAHQHNGRVKVLFRNKHKKTRAYWMAPRTYRRVTSTPATVENYKAGGKVTRARNTDILDAEKYATKVGTK